MAGADEPQNYRFGKTQPQALAKAGTYRQRLAGAVAGELVKHLKAAFAQIKVGDPREPRRCDWPLLDACAIMHFEAAIKDAVAQGGEVVLGGPIVWFASGA